MLARIILGLSLLFFAWLPAAAQAPAGADTTSREQIAPLIEATGVPELMEIIRAEGLSHAASLEADMFPGRGRARWSDMVDRIYDPARMLDLFAVEMAERTPPGQIDPVVDFYGAELGQRIVSLELSAREALLEPAVEAASNEYLALLQDEGGARLDLLEEFAGVNDLVESNVSAALNANFAFYTGLNNAGGFGEIREEGEMLREIWSQEEQIRFETALWVMSYLAMAYQPLDDRELDAYIGFSRSEAGQQLNANLFHAFDELFQVISYEMGMAAAQFMIGEDL